MPILQNYHHFEGRHWDTGSVCNALAYQGVIAPHTGKPFSEALLMGVSGGVAFGYFLFDYDGYHPFVVLITRNTFDPLDTLLERLGIAQNRLHTPNPAKGERNLIDTLQSGRPALVWADMFSLPYNALTYAENNWGMTPVLVYGHDSENVHIADRSSQALTVSAEVFAGARARIKKDKFHLMTLEAPDPRKLSSAVQKGIWQAISLYTETPPKGSKDNFGFAALKKWADMLTNQRNKQSWARYFPRGKGLFSALAGFDAQPGVFNWICTWGAGEGAERGMYADFLDEAAAILNKPNLGAAAQKFRGSAALWCELAEAALPDEVALFKETRLLLMRKHALFIEKGGAAVDEIHACQQRLQEIRAQAADDFPLTEAETNALLEKLRHYVLKIHDAEYNAVETMQAAIA